ncbi:NnrU family protein [Aquabacterium sp.]|uniref:NnrU family protein n=1 Tax=Aquabacterium sp. TaxID=1872578 RepID=UPI003784195A
MTVLVLGLLLFLGMHSARIVAEGTRTGFIAARGEKAWKGLYTLVSVLGFGLVVWGYGLARQQPVVLWASPTWTRHLAALLMLPSFVLLTAAYVPGNGLKARLGHPMLLGVKTWALAHLLANNTLADLLLFGGFLAWAVLCFRSARARDRAAGTRYPAGSAARSGLTLVVGVIAWAVFGFWLHGPLIGVRPFG